MEVQPSLPVLVIRLNGARFTAADTNFGAPCGRAVHVLLQELGELELHRLLSAAGFVAAS